ncbi:MAG: 1-deoxy-D-xylulose-5-phosphate reductoisomerase, partial [Hyphomicrobiales bacterium]|nr:1-deoxy-D-xylulose-5-phosphate reductoisomerase [Hyphomicrobiales bacterium]
MSIRSISLLGATGSIGAQVADLVAASPETCQLVALSADKNDKDLLALARRFRPRLLAVNDPAAWQRLSAALADEPVEVLCGEEGQIAVA